VREVRAVLRTRLVDVTQIAFQKYAPCFVALQDLRAGGIARRELLGKFVLAHADKLGQLLDVALSDAHLGDAAAIRALRAIDFGLDLLAEAAQTPVGMAVAFQICSKTRVLAVLLVLKAANLDEVGNHFLKSIMTSTDEFYRIQKLPPYVFAVINEMKAKARAAQLDVVDLGMGNPDGATPEPVVKKLIDAVRNPRNHRYSLSRGIPRLRAEIVKRYSTKYGVELDSETEAIVTIGAKDALAHLLFAVIGPGDAVVSPNPAYPIHQYGVIMAEGHACMLPMPTPAEFLNRLEHLYNTSSRKPRMILISFPHNPTTHCVDLQFFRDIVALAARHGTMIVHDFAYADLGFDGYEPPSILQVEGAKEIAVEIYSMSKSFNMAGWRVGFCLGNKKMIGALARIKSYLDYGVFQPIQIASIIALRECAKDTEKIRAVYQKRRDLLITGLEHAGWPVESPRGTMFVWAPIPEKYRAKGSLEFSKLLMEKALVAVSPGIGFGPLGEGHVRFALIENQHRTRQATKAIQQFLKK
jgi:alanine-synthesizing transaminase